MSKNSGSRKTILLGVLVVVVIIGICFVCVTLYAKNEINKEKFQMPEIDVPLLTQELTDKDKAFAYAMNQYNAAVSADNTEGRWRTDVRRLDEDWQTPFSKADNAILLGIRKKAGDQIKEMYPKQYGNVRLREVRDAIPPFVKQAQDVTDFSITLGRENDRNETVDTDRYFLTLTFDPNCEDTQAMLNSDAYQNICKELSPVAALNDTQIEMQSVSMSFVIDRASEELKSVEIRRDMLVTTTIVLTDESADLLGQKEGKIVLPYGTSQIVEFSYYGAHFTDEAIAVKPGDIKRLPAAVFVNENASKDDFKLTFTSSDPEALTFDADGTMTVSKDAHEEKVTVSMTLEYEGKTYTDELTVFITELELEVEGNVGA